METISKTKTVNLTTASTKTSDSSLSFWKTLEDNRFAITPMILVVMACIGGFAAAVAMDGSWVKLAFLAFSCTFCLATILAVMPMKTVVYSAIVAILIDIVMFII